MTGSSGLFGPYQHRFREMLGEDKNLAKALKTHRNGGVLETSVYRPPNPFTTLPDARLTVTKKELRKVVIPYYQQIAEEALEQCQKTEPA